MQGEKSQLVPEDIGKQAAYMLLEEVQRGGICDSMHQVRGQNCGMRMLWSYTLSYNDDGRESWSLCTPSCFHAMERTTEQTSNDCHGA